MKYYNPKVNESFIFEIIGHQKASWGVLQFIGYINNNRQEIYGLPSLQQINIELMKCKYKKGSRIQITRLSQGHKNSEEAKFDFKRLDSQLRF